MSTEQKLPHLGKRSAHHVGGLPTRGAVFSHRNTVGNLHRALRQRVLFTEVDGEMRPTLRPAGRYATPAMDRWRRGVLARLDTPSPLTHKQFCEKFVGSKKARYERAASNLLTGRVRGNSAKVIGFLKPEKYTADAPPRVISPRSPEYLLEVGCFMEPLEKKLYRAVARMEGHECIMKGFSLGDRARVIRSHWDSTKGDPVALGLDASKFDQHVSRQALQYEHSFYLAAYHNNPTLQKLLNQQLMNSVTCFCEDGIVSWNSNGGRMSGDMNTALGNCLLSASMLYAWAREQNVEIRAVVDGDDCVAIMDRRDMVRFLTGIQEWYMERGFRMKIEAPAYSFEEIEFCQCRPVYLPGGLRLVRNPIKAITQDHVWLERGGITHREVLAATGEGGVALYGDCPVLGAYYRMLRGTNKLSKNAKRELRDEHSWLRHFRGDFVKQTDLDDAARISFGIAWGITPAHQVALENYFQVFDLDSALANITTNSYTTDQTSSLLESITPLIANFRL